MRVWTSELTLRLEKNDKDWGTILTQILGMDLVGNLHTKGEQKDMEYDSDICVKLRRWEKKP